MPDLPAKPAPGSPAPPIELGTPLDVETSLTVHLPPGTTAQTPAGTSVVRDYATFSSHYAAQGNTVTASRRVNFLLRQVPASRAADYNAFLHAVQSDQAQLFTLDRPAGPPAKAPSSTSLPLPDLPRQIFLDNEFYFHQYIHQLIVCTERGSLSAAFSFSGGNRLSGR